MTFRPERRMWFRLAALWGCTVSEAIDRCSASEFREWMALYRAEPWGWHRVDLAAGIVASVIANVHRAPNTTAYTPADFMPGGRKDHPTQDVKKAREAFDAIARAFNG